MLIKMFKIGLLVSFISVSLGLVGCSSAPGPDKEYQKQAAENSDQQLSREAAKLN